ncbi:MAG: hypothetical protein KDE14_01760 [Rhodobacteraceae bacterium]|nr:hypothetical protein [Paracoccaceae bacterium]
MAPAETVRFIRADTSALDRPQLCIHVDTEEEFDWTGPFRRSNTSVQAISNLRLAHDIFRRYSLKPVYIVDYPVASSELARQTLGPWVNGGECLIGAQLHPWVTPPHEEVICLENSFPSNLPRDLERRKLECLAKTIRENLGENPRVYKAGRYGLDLARIDTLVELGFRVDTSVVPFKSFAGKGGGPDFFGLPDQPFWSLKYPDFLFLPVTGSLIGPWRNIDRASLDRYLFSDTAIRWRIPSVLARLGLVERISLSPEGADENDMIRLMDNLVGHGKKVLCLSFHSPSLMPGCTPYVSDERSLQRFIYILESVLEHFFGKLNGAPTDSLTLRSQLGKGV